MSVEVPIDPDSQLWKSWQQYKQSDEYAATRHWAGYEKHIDGSLWAVYMRGYDDALCRSGNNLVGVLLLAAGFIAIGFLAGWLF